jgi:hypothetical protein
VDVRWKTNYDLNYSCKFLLIYLASYTFLYAVNTRKSNEQKLRLKAVFCKKKSHLTWILLTRNGNKRGKTSESCFTRQIETLTTYFLLLISIYNDFCVYFKILFSQRKRFSFSRFFCVENVKIWQRSDGVYPEAKKYFPEILTSIDIDYSVKNEGN